MKKNLFMVAAVALVALISCNKETDSPLQPAPVSDIKFEAEFVNEQTKTSIGDADNGYRNVTWDLGDLVHINGTLFKATGYKEDGKAIFVTEDLNFATAEQYNAIYPASAGETLAAVTIPAAQDGTFANAAIAVAQSENRSLAFMNVASLIKFQVPAECSDVTFESTAYLAGTFPVTFGSDGLPAIGTVSSASKTITLSGSFKTGTDYYVAVLPGSHKFTVRLDGYLSKASTKAVTTSRANIANLQTLPSPEASKIYLKGGWNGWGTTTPLYKEGAWYVARNIDATKSDFKFHDTENNKWMGKQSDFYLNNYCTTAAGQGDNIPLGAAGKYDFYLSQEKTSIYVTTAGGVPPGVTRPVRLLIKNNGKSAMNIYVWYSENSKEERPCGDWPGKAVDMKNKVTVCGTEYICYEFGAEYYGKTMNYIINWNGGQTGNVEGVYWGQDNYYNL